MAKSSGARPVGQHYTKDSSRHRYGAGEPPFVVFAAAGEGGGKGGRKKRETEGKGSPHFMLHEVIMVKSEEVRKPGKGVI